MLPIRNPQALSIHPFRALPTRQTSTLRHRLVLLLKPETDALGALLVLVDTSHDAVFFAGGEGL